MPGLNLILDEDCYSLSHPISKKQFKINATWTSVSLRNGWRHYRISGQRHAHTGREYEMMAVCDRSVRFWIDEIELRDHQRWRPGWQNGLVES